MTLREQIDTELDRLSEQELDALYPIVQRFIEARKNAGKTGIMNRLRQIKIEAPADFSINLDAL